MYKNLTLQVVNKIHYKKKVAPIGHKKKSSPILELLSTK